MVNVWEGTEAAAEARRFAELWSIDGTILVDEDGSVANLLSVRGVPTNILVEADGTVVEVGAVTPAELEAGIRRLLGADGSIDPSVPAAWHWQHEPEHLERHVTARNDPKT